MNSSQKEDCHAVIHAAAVSASGVGAGLAQVPAGDAALIVPIQIGMVVALGKVFDQHITDAVARGVVMGMAGMHVGRAASQFIVGWIPGFGNAINAGTAFAVTEAMGWAVADRFDKGKI